MLKIYLILCLAKRISQVVCYSPSKLFFFSYKAHALIYFMFNSIEGMEKVCISGFHLSRLVSKKSHIELSK